MGYGYDPVGNRTNLIYPDGRVLTYTYDLGNRLDTVTDWNNGQFGYNYDHANRMTGFSLPNGVESNYNYDDAGRLTLLSHSVLTETLASYAYSLDKVGNRRVLTETLLAPTSATPEGTYLEENGLVVMEVENAAQVISGTNHAWQVKTTQSGYTGTAYLQSLPDTDTLYQTGEITASPALRYSVEFSTPGTYTVWVRGMASSAAADSLYVGLGEQMVNVTGFAPRQWDWGGGVSLDVQQSGVYTLSVWMREDGLRVDRLLLTTDTAYLPADFGPSETARQTEASTGTLTTLARTIDYGYDDLYRLTSANYTTGEAYQYTYDPVGNRLQQIIDGDTTEYLYDAANGLAAADGVNYTFDDNGNLLNTGSMTNTWDAANRLISANRDGNLVQPIYNGLGDRVGQTANSVTTTFALDIQGLPEVIYTSEGNAYLHLPGVIVAESSTGEIRYLLADGLGSVRQAIDETATVVTYQVFDPYGNPVNNVGGEPYGYTGEWFESYTHLLHLRARWYAPETGTFLSIDPVESEPPYQYVGGNVVNRSDPAGLQGANPQNPYDPNWCTDWENPYQLSCAIITDPSTPEWQALLEMRHIYQVLSLGAAASGKSINSALLANFLATSVTEFSEPWPWGMWLRSDSNFNKWHNAQLELFFRSAVLRAAEDCQTSVGPWKVRRLPHKRNGIQLEWSDPFAEIQKDGVLFSLIPIFSFESEVGTTLGKYWLEGDFYAENIRKSGDWIIADTKIERFVNDRFDFEDDFGGVPVNQLVPDWRNLGIGYVPNVWAQTLVEKGWASYV